MQLKSAQFEDQARRALKNETLQHALADLPGGFAAQRKAAKDRLPEFDALCEIGENIRNHTLMHLDDYLEAFERNATAAGTTVHWAATAIDACDQVLDICRQHDAKIVAKGKSMVTEEIGLNAHLEKAGLKPVETDLGDYIVQVRGEYPSHIIAPAIHVTADDIAKDFRNHHTQFESGRPLNTPKSLVDEARTIMRETFLSADVGITGANFLVAETGSTILVTNEGNGDLSQSLPPVHIVIATIDKVVPTLNDTICLLRVLARSATGQDITAYTTITTGPRRNSDTDGPAQCHIILLDGGRSALLGTQFQDVLRCIRCGACLNHCPVYGAIGGHAYGWIYPGPIGAVLTPALNTIATTSDLPKASTFCGRCDEVCPMRIPLTSMMRQWRQTSFDQKFIPRTQRAMLKLWSWIATRPTIYHTLTRFGIPIITRLAGRNGTLRPLPFMSSWTRDRAFPKPQGQSFQHLWANRKSGHTS